MNYVIILADSIYGGGYGYDGEDCFFADVEPGKVYLTYENASDSAERLEQTTGEEFKVVDYVPCDVEEMLTEISNTEDFDDMFYEFDMKEFLELDPDDRDWEYDGHGARRCKDTFKQV